MNQKYCISDAAKILGLSCEMLRHYERRGIIAPERAGNGYRCYSSRDINLLMGAIGLQGTGFSLEEVEVLLNSSSLDAVQGMFKDMEKKINKEIRWQQLVLDSLKKRMEGYEKIKNPKDKYTIKTNSAVYRIRVQYNTLFLMEEVTLSHVDKWVSLMPVVQVSPEFTIDSIYNKLDDYNFGFMVDESIAAELELIDTPGIMRIPSQTCLTTIISSEGVSHIKASMLYDAVKYIEGHGMKMCGNPWGITIGSFSVDKVHKKYHEIFMPVQL